MALADLTQERLKDLLRYEPKTGEFIWLLIRGKGRKGTIAGCIDKSTGYRVIRVDGNKYHAHRLAWLYVYGAWPSGQIDHLNHRRSDNRTENLRDVSYQENRKNNTMLANNTSGITGVNMSRGKWRAYIKVSGRQVFLGRFSTKEEAIVARKEAESKHGFHPNHGREAA